MWSLTSALRAVLPISASGLFAYSVEKQLLGGQLVYVIMAIVGAIHAIILWLKAYQFEKVAQ